MLILTFKKFNESTMFSFFRKKNDGVRSNNLVGKVVAVDTKSKAGDGCNLIHIYIIKDVDGKIGKFAGNIKYKNGKSHFKRSTISIVEPIQGWRELSTEEYKVYNPK